MTIALLATGDEIVNGDIVNTNTQQMAAALFEAKITIGMHLSVNDEPKDMVNAMQYLLAHHDGLIITGGLGPTSDDRTRYALSEVLGQPLVLDDASLQHIKLRHEKVNLKTSPSNQQQALFPESATILLNENGTANACQVQLDGKLIFMLPGPPRECLPIFHRDVMPSLSHLAGEHAPELRWRVFGLAESVAAERIDNIVAPYDCQTGYRWFYPYLDCKVSVFNASQLAEIQRKVDEYAAPHSLCESNTTALEKLIETVIQGTTTLNINDNATGGLLSSKLLTPNTLGKISFEGAIHLADLNINIQGLERFWRNESAGSCYLEIIINDIAKRYEIPYRNRFVRLYCIEWISAKILKAINTLADT